MKKGSLMAFVSISLVILLAGTYHPTDIRTTTVAVTGMRCGACAEKVEAALIRVKGVKKVSVDFKEGAAQVEFNPDIVALDDLRNVIAKTGFGIDSKSDRRSCKTTDNAACSGEKKTGACCAAKSKKSI